jgi:hypothetical protein
LISNSATEVAELETEENTVPAIAINSAPVEWRNTSLCI